MSDNPAFLPPRNRMVVAILALLGLFIALYMLAYALGLTGPVICGIGNCEAVQSSSYARIGPLPVAALGVAGYMALMFVSFVGLQVGTARLRLVPVSLLVGGGLGLLFSGYLTYLEAFVIHAWCQWCVASAIIMLLICMAILPEFKRLGETE